MVMYGMLLLRVFLYNYTDRDTPTSAGPNSFYKGKMGFSDPRAGYKRYSDDD